MKQHLRYVFCAAHLESVARLVPYTQHHTRPSHAPSHTATLLGAQLTYVGRKGHPSRRVVLSKRDPGNSGVRVAATVARLSGKLHVMEVYKLGNSYIVQCYDPERALVGVKTTIERRNIEEALVVPG